LQKELLYGARFYVLPLTGGPEGKGKPEKMPSFPETGAIGGEDGEGAGMRCHVGADCVDRDLGLPSYAGAASQRHNKERVYKKCALR